MEVGGWLLLALSWGTITSLVLFCLARVLHGDHSGDEGD